MPLSEQYKGSYNIDLQNAVKHLYAQKIISKDKDIAVKMHKSPGTVSNYINGKSNASFRFRKSFEKAFNLMLADFPGAVPSASGNDPKGG